MKVTKLDAAKRQLVEAIRLFFSHGDPISTETLAGAASNVLRDLGKRIGIPAPFKDSDFVKDERRKEWINELNKFQNFFKHADRDPDEVLEFKEEVVKLTILEGCILHRKITKKAEYELMLFELWFAAGHQDYVLDGPVKTLMKVHGITQDYAEDRHIFLGLLKANEP